MAIEVGVRSVAFTVGAGTSLLVANREVHAGMGITFVLKSEACCSAISTTRFVGRIGLAEGPLAEPPVPPADDAGADAATVPSSIEESEVVCTNGRGWRAYLGEAAMAARAMAASLSIA
jgi:hypothetical protein